MAKIGVDPDCVELARKFLAAETPKEPVSEAEAMSLAEDIQRAIEDWFMAHEPYAEPCTGAAYRRGCTCRMSSVNTATIDPPEPVIDRHCPLHGSRRDPDDARQQRLDDKEYFG